MTGYQESLKLSDEWALALLKSEIIKRFEGAEIPGISLSRIREAYNYALREAIKAYNENSSIDLATAVYMQLRAYLGLKKLTDGPLLILVPEDIKFNQVKSGQAKILLIQPRMPDEKCFEEKATPRGNLLLVKSANLKIVKDYLLECLQLMKKVRPDFACLPELCFVKDHELEQEFAKVASEIDSFIIAGTYHDEKEEANICLIFCPNGKVIKQRKLYASKEVGEGIAAREEEAIHIIDYEKGKFSVLICIDSEAEAVRDALKERLYRCKCPELIFNPSFTKAKDRAYSQLANLMSLIFAAMVFCNSSKVGGSCALYPTADLKETGFVTNVLPCQPEEIVYDTVKINLAALQVYKQSKIKCLIAMKQ